MLYGQSDMVQMNAGAYAAEFDEKLKEAQHHLDRLREIMIASGETCEGNCFLFHNSVTYAPELRSKQINLYACGKQARRILEIGFNAGHSCLLFLLANPDSLITIFDIDMWRYTRPCFEYLNSQFPGRMEFIAGDSLHTVPAYYAAHPDVSFDVVHVDGAHDAIHVQGDMENVRRLSTTDTLVILDDDNNYTIREINQRWEDEGKIVRVSGLLDTLLYTHLVVHWT